MIKNAIIPHIIDYLRFILSKEYLIPKDLAIELEDGESIKKSIFGALGTIDRFKVKILGADLSVSPEEPEVILLLQLDSLAPYAFRFDGEKYTSHFLLDQKTWLSLSDLLLAKALVGIEQVKELPVSYAPLADFTELYQYLISFLNFDAAHQ